ncbi:hypothetical protein E0H71_00375 [Rhizobium leguminosarum bv. viciae]|uniref:hypothetical protein n=1 Tax=Rhizobium leguminosarum TaxID=384 RepID=UPI001038B1FA|nr:hypothetical protein [Rhizobium leguminosarum]TCA58091.1 hypothetical protein E0H71_00375 [Rhizobium leguminosarum bv. viciae]
MSALIAPLGSGCFADEIDLSAKSFIATVDLLDPSQFDADAKSCQQAMAAVVDCATIGEDPSSASKEGGQYRIWSSVKFNVECDGDEVASWSAGPLETAFGSEFKIFSTSGDVSRPLAFAPQTGPAGEVTFSYRVRGRPNSAAIQAMALVKPRTCTYIWHEVNGTISCGAGKPAVTAKISGSQFPSRRLWVDGSVRAEQSQGPFKDLWVCDPSDPMSVK